MSTNEHRTPKLATVLIGVFTALAALVAIGLIVQEYGPGNMGYGFLTGAGITIIAAAFAGWRTLRRPDSATTIERAWTSMGDERDNAVLTRALAVVGLTAPLVVGGASIVLAVGAPMAPVLAILNFALIGIFIGAFTYANRRN